MHQMAVLLSVRQLESRVNQPPGKQSQNYNPLCFVDLFYKKHHTLALVRHNLLAITQHKLLVITQHDKLVAN